MNVHIYKYENKYTGWLSDFGPLNTNDALDLHYAVKNCTYSGPYCVLKEGNSLVSVRGLYESAESVG